jgi:hypothetical protein
VLLRVSGNRVPRRGLELGPWLTLVIATSLLTVGFEAQPVAAAPASRSCPSSRPTVGFLPGASLPRAIKVTGTTCITGVAVADGVQGRTPGASYSAEGFECIGKRDSKVPVGTWSYRCKAGGKRIAFSYSAGLLGGSYATTITGESGALGAFSGTWTISFVAGVYQWKHSAEPGGSVDAGQYKISGSTITFRDTSATGDSIGCPGVGKYRFKLTGKTLSFTLISDPVNSCHGREVVLTSGPFTNVS